MWGKGVKMTLQEVLRSHVTRFLYIVPWPVGKYAWVLNVGQGQNYVIKRSVLID